MISNYFDTNPQKVFNFNNKMIKSSKQQTPTNMLQPNDGDPIEHPSDNDVLSGRGGRINNHSGNIHFRKLVTEEKAKYISLNKKMDKKYIAIDIVDQIRKLEPPGRFLKKDGLHWYEIGMYCIIFE